MKHGEWLMSLPAEELAAAIIEGIRKQGWRQTPDHDDLTSFIYMLQLQPPTSSHPFDPRLLEMVAHVRTYLPQ